MCHRSPTPAPGWHAGGGGSDKRIITILAERAGYEDRSLVLSILTSGGGVSVARPPPSVRRGPVLTASDGPPRVYNRDDGGCGRSGDPLALEDEEVTGWGSSLRYCGQDPGDAHRGPRRAGRTQEIILRRDRVEFVATAAPSISGRSSSFPARIEFCQTSAIAGDAGDQRPGARPHQAVDRGGDGGWPPGVTVI